MTDNPKDAERLAEVCERMRVGTFGHEDGVALRHIIASRDATIADLERQLAEAQDEILRLTIELVEAALENSRLRTPPVAEASGESCNCPANPGEDCPLTTKQCRERAQGTPQPTTDHTERARELIRHLRYIGWNHLEPEEGMLPVVIETLTAVERAGAESRDVEVAKLQTKITAMESFLAAADDVIACAERAGAEKMMDFGISDARWRKHFATPVQIRGRKRRAAAKP